MPTPPLPLDRRGFLTGSIGLAVAAALPGCARRAGAQLEAARTRVALEALSVSEPIVIRSQEDADRLVGRRLVVAPSFRASTTNCVIRLEAGGVTLRDFELVGRVDFAERWQGERFKRRDDQPGLGPRIRGIRSLVGLSDLSLRNLRVAGFPSAGIQLALPVGLRLEDVEIERCFVGVSIQDDRNRYGCRNLELRRVTVRDTWGPRGLHDEIRSRLGHGGAPGGDGFLLHGVDGVVVEDCATLGEQFIGIKCPGARNLRIARYRGVGLMLSTPANSFDTAVESVRVVDSRFSKKLGWGASTELDDAANLLQFSGKVRDVEIRGSRVEGGRREARWKDGHGCQLAPHGPHDPQGVRFEGCEFSELNGYRGRTRGRRVEAAALHVVRPDGTHDLSVRLVGGVRAFLAENRFVEQRHKVLTPGRSRYIDA